MNVTADESVMVDDKIDISKVMPLHLTLILMVTMILSILVDTFISKISLPMQPVPEIGSISGA